MNNYCLHKNCLKSFEIFSTNLDLQLHTWKNHNIMYGVLLQRYNKYIKKSILEEQYLYECKKNIKNIKKTLVRKINLNNEIKRNSILLNIKNLPHDIKDYILLCSIQNFNDLLILSEINNYYNNYVKKNISYYLKKLLKHSLSNHKYCESYINYYLKIILIHSFSNPIKHFKDYCFFLEMIEYENNNNYLNLDMVFIYISLKNKIKLSIDYLDLYELLIYIFDELKIVQIINRNCIIINPLFIHKYDLYKLVN